MTAAAPALADVDRRPDPRASSGAARPADGMIDAWSRAWVIAIVVLAVVAGVALFLDLPSPIRPVATIAFLLLGPGMALARLLRLDSHLAEFTLGFSLSVALGGLVAGALLYLGTWSPARAMVILTAVAIGALALDPVLVPRGAWTQLRRAALVRARLLVGVRQPSDAPAPIAAEHSEVPAPAQAAPTPGAAAMPEALATREAPTAPGTVAMPSFRPGRSRPAPASDALPPPPVAIVRRGPRRAPVAIPPSRSGRRRQALGVDPLESSDVSRRLRSTIDQVIDDLADRKDAPPS